jgi:hypothetical protein
MPTKFFPQHIHGVWHAAHRSADGLSLISLAECSSYRDARTVCEQAERDQARRRVVEPDPFARRPAPSLRDAFDHADDDPPRRWGGR